MGARLGLLTPPGRPDLANAHFASDYLRDTFAGMGFRPRRAEVIHWGVADAWFGTAPSHDGPIRILYAGRLSPEKGVETVIEAFGHVARWLPDRSATLTIVGGSGPTEYEQVLRRLVAKLGLGERVAFLGKVDRAAIIDVYAQHNVFVLPSVWQEPFSIALLEAMASGLVPVGTLTGGTGEILQPELNGLTFEPGDAQACAMQLRRLFEDRDLLRSLGGRARSSVRERFRLEAMLDSVEESLQATLAGSGRAPRQASQTGWVLTGR
jgi:glycosyltransferase involved in cell wall biosynthesis